MLFDAHTHLNFEKYTDEERSALAQEIEASELGYIIDVADCVRGAEQALKDAEVYDWCYAAVGIHPDHASVYNDTDIEEIRRFKPSLVDYTMNDAQRQMIAAAEHPEVEFIRLWTMKEALLKLTGLGLRTDLKTLDLSGYRFTTRVETQKGYVCTVCQK